MKITHSNLVFTRMSYENELELEKAVVANSKQMFGSKSVYFDIKKRVKNGMGKELLLRSNK
ncbi:MAG: hypothetical protein COU67_01335 [Candidatus Pacebacteria bacterium CG10_big_fil_rev_8_21_14_0_10_44_54]|nr:MAG: hypothetical protein COU67_01335 [Candidatus Pacebacteria bacterium CG10_big_fil_rev_8_21_14_0_10_44_54]